MDFDTFYHKLDENVDTTNYVAKYEAFGQRLKEFFNISSHEDSFIRIKMAAYFNSGILYKFFFKTLNKSKTLKKINKLVNNKVFEIKPSGDTDTQGIVVEVAYDFKTIKKMLEKGVLNSSNALEDINI